MKTFPLILLIVFSSCLLNAQVTINELLKISADDGFANDQFGKSIAMTDNHIIVGADRNSDNKSLIGAAYIYSFENNWEQQTKLTASDAAENDYFGCSVDIYNDYAVVGAYGNSTNFQNAGAAYVFYNNSGNWEQVAKLTASDEFAELWFGYAVAIYGDYIAVTAKDDNDMNTNSGAVYVFYNNQGVWEQMDKITEPDGSLTGFGRSISLYWEYILVGYPEDTENGYNSGSAIVYHLNDGNWYKQKKLLPLEGGEYLYFANTVKISSYGAFVGYENDNYGNGSVYLFSDYPGSWHIESIIVPWSGVYDFFGSSISVYEYYLIVGAKGVGSSTGAAFIFGEYLGGYFETNILKPSDGVENDNFGSAVAISSNYAVVGTNKVLSEEPCSAYVFTGNWYVSINSVTNSKLSIYPNPSNGIVNFNNTNKNIDKIKIYDITGKLIKEFYQVENEIDISDIEAGIYIISIQTDNEIFTSKIIKN